jgi:CRP/FNR family transcriptional regulator
MLDFQTIKNIYPDFEKALIEEICTELTTKNFTANEVIMHSGQYIKSSLLVVSGKIKVYREDDNGKEFFIYYLEPGSACAISIMCAVRNEKSQLLAIAESDVQAVLVPFAKVSDWMNTYPSWYRFVIETYRKRFEELLITIDNIAFKSLDERIEFYLKKQCETHHTTTLSISHQQIADDLGSSREVISRLLKKMEQLGKVKMLRKQIKVVG